MELLRQELNHERSLRLQLQDELARERQIVADLRKELTDYRQEVLTVMADQADKHREAMVSQADKHRSEIMVSLDRLLNTHAGVKNELSRKRTIDPVDNNKVHGIAIVSYDNNNTQTIRTIAGQKDYVMKTIRRHEDNLNAQIILRFVETANPIDLRRNILSRGNTLRVYDVSRLSFFYPSSPLRSDHKKN